jgi:hypothetical protein
LKDYKIIGHGFAVVSMFVVSFAWAQGLDKSALDQCTVPKISVHDRLSACSDIDAKNESGRSLAAAYCSRGFAFTEKRELDRAMVDLDQGIRIDAKFACAYSNRGRVWAFKGDLD